MKDEPKGLYGKYIVLKTEEIEKTGLKGLLEELRRIGSGSAVYFVLRLDKDPHARAAANIYALSISEENPTLSNDLLKLLGKLEEEIIAKGMEDG